MYADGQHPLKPAGTSWPVKLYLTALVFAFLTLVVFTQALDGPEVNVGRVGTQAGICLTLGVRLLWAMHRKEQSKTWRIYVTSMFLAAPIWLLVEGWVRAL